MTGHRGVAFHTEASKSKLAFKGRRKCLTCDTILVVGFICEECLDPDEVLKHRRMMKSIPALASRVGAAAKDYEGRRDDISGGQSDD